MKELCNNFYDAMTTLSSDLIDSIDNCSQGLFDDYREKGIEIIDSLSLDLWDQLYPCLAPMHVTKNLWLELFPLLYLFCFLKRRKNDYSVYNKRCGKD